jgi:hypothetical protein
MLDHQFAVGVDPFVNDVVLLEFGFYFHVAFCVNND